MDGSHLLILLGISSAITGGLIGKLLHDPSLIFLLPSIALAVASTVSSLYIRTRKGDKMKTMSNEQEFKERLEFLGRTYSSIVYSFITFFINITILYAKGYLPLSPVVVFYCHHQHFCSLHK